MNQSLFIYGEYLKFGFMLVGNQLRPFISNYRPANF